MENSAKLLVIPIEREDLKTGIGVCSKSLSISYFPNYNNLNLGLSYNQMWSFILLLMNTLNPEEVDQLKTVY